MKADEMIRSIIDVEAACWTGRTQAPRRRSPR